MQKSRYKYFRRVLAAQFTEVSMKKNTHIVNAKQIANLMRYAKTPQDRNILIKGWVEEMRKACRLSAQEAR